MNNYYAEFGLPDLSNLKITCECGAKVKRQSMSGHRRTAKHLTWIQDHFRERCNRMMEEENQRIEEENLRRQEEALRYYQRKKKEEDDRVARRSLPSHIVDIVFSQKVKEINKEDKENKDENKEDKDEIDCGICFEALSRETVFFTKCGHMMCKACEKKLYEKKTTQCPECRSEF